MIHIFKSRFLDPSNVAPVCQETKSMTEHINDFLNGDHVLDTSFQSSHDFDSPDSVDFNQELVSSHHDVFDVASGQDKVFSDKLVTDNIQVSDISETIDSDN